MMSFRFHPAAAAELESAVLYYEDCSPGLGVDFLEETYSAIERMRRFPQAWPQISPRVRRCLVSRFPFGVLYQIISDEIVVLAVMHLHRAPIAIDDRS